MMPPPDLPAHQQWRAALEQAGYRNATRLHSVHPSSLLAPGVDRAAVETACAELLAAQPEHNEGLEIIVYLLQLRGSGAQATEFRTRLHIQRLREMSVPEQAQSAALEFLLAADGHGAQPAAVPAAYVSALFDGYAAGFDAHLQRLDYRAPDLLLQRVARYLAPSPASLDILDLGCGTGLAGALLRPHAKALHGVDLSASMLEMARARGCYDSLTQADLVTACTSWPDQIDLVTAADVFNYLGAIGPALNAASTSLRTGGHCLFTVERGDCDRFELSADRRYRHSERYVRDELAAAGLHIVVLEHDVLRKQHNLPVQGLVVLARRTWARSGDQVTPSRTPSDASFGSR